MSYDINVDSLAPPLIDDGIIANLDNIIARFQVQSKNVISGAFTENDLMHTVEELNRVKSLLQQINVDSCSSCVESISSTDTNVSESSTLSSVTKTTNGNEIIRNSIEMIRNGGKFTKPIGHIAKESPKLSSHSTIKRSLKRNSNLKLLQTFYANCRISKYEDNSFTFDIIQPKSSVMRNDRDEIKNADAIIVSLSSGETALFPSKNSKLFAKVH
jgi:hypothetical protein